MLQIMSDSNTNTTNFLTVLVQVQNYPKNCSLQFFMCYLIALLYTKSFRIEVINFNTSPNYSLEAVQIMYYNLIIIIKTII